MASLSPWHDSRPRLACCRCLADMRRRPLPFSVTGVVSAAVEAPVERLVVAGRRRLGVPFMPDIIVASASKLVLFILLASKLLLAPSRIFCRWAGALLVNVAILIAFPLVVRAMPSGATCVSCMSFGWKDRVSEQRRKEFVRCNVGEGTASDECACLCVMRGRKSGRKDNRARDTTCSAGPHWMGGTSRVVGGR